MRSEAAQLAAARRLPLDHPDCRLYTIAYLHAGHLDGVDSPEDAHEVARDFLDLRNVTVAELQPFFSRWQELLEAAPRGRPLFTNLVEHHHWLAAKLKLLRQPGWPTLLLPCQLCGCVFESRRGEDRYRPECGVCRAPLGERLLDEGDPLGRPVFRCVLTYPRSRPGSPLSRMAAYVLGECAHPGCDRPFVATHTKTRHCEKHRSLTAKQQRRRAKTPAM